MVISGSDDPSIKFWCFETGEDKLTLTGHGDCINRIAISQDEYYLVSGSADETIKMWNMNGKNIKTYYEYS